MDALGQKNRLRIGLISRLTRFWKKLTAINKRDERKVLTERYARYSTAQLLKIIKDKVSYTPLALELAFTELSSRNIDRFEVESYAEQHYKDKENTFINTYQNDLTFIQKLFFSTLGLIPLLSYPLRQNFKEDNYILKIEQATTYTAIGWISFIVSGILSAFIFPDSELFSIFIIFSLLFMGCYIYDITVCKKERLKKLREYYYWKEKSN